MPKISVIIPVYNTAKYLKRCLDSVINQTLKDIEIICVDDGSTDGSLDILKEYSSKDGRIKIIQQKNQYSGIARNNGIKVASGEYLGFVDSDDEIDLDFYEKLYSKAKESDFNIIKGNYVEVHDDTKIKKTNENKIIRQELKKTQIPYKTYCTSWWSAIYNRDFINRFNIKFALTRRLQDVPFLYKAICMAETFAIVDTVNYYYYVYDQSTSHANLSGEELYKKYSDWLNSRKDVLDFLNNNELSKNKYMMMFYNKVYLGCILNLKDIIASAPQDKISYWIDVICGLLNECKYDISNECKDKLIKYILVKDYTRVYKEINFNKIQLKSLEKIFSIKNDKDKIHKIIKILGLKIKLKRNKK